MTDEDAVRAVARAEPLLRLSLAWQVLRHLDDEETRLLEGWAERIGAACDALGADVGPRASRLRVWGEGASDGLIPVLAPLLAEAGATQADLDLVTEVGSALDPDRLGTWAELDGTDRSIGWHLGRVVTGQLAAWLPWTSDLDPGWEVRRWSRSVGATPVDVLEVVVPGSGDAAVAAAISALGSCGVPSPPDAAIGALARHAGDGVGVSLVASGAERWGGGIDVAADDVPALIDVLHAVGCGTTEVDRVARVRGAAGEPAILGVGAGFRPNGLDAVVRLRLS